MHNHFDKHLNIKQLILEADPRLVVECGAGGGNCTKKLQSLQNGISEPFRLIPINDSMGVPLGFSHTDWVCGISYLELEKFADGSIDFCLIDTDHNYWTLKQELEVLKRKMRPGGIVVMHDTETYGKASGHMFNYNVDVKYPFDEIVKCEEEGKTMISAIDEVWASKDFGLVKAVTTSHGATAIKRL